MANIYDPNTGLQVRSFEDIKSQVNDGLKDVFGEDIDLNNGSGFDTLGNALAGGLLQLLKLSQGAINSRNISLATGQELDDFGEQVDTPRLSDEDDDTYRLRLINSKNEQVATIGALNREIGLVDNVNKVRVYDINTTKSNLTMVKGQIVCVVLPAYSSNGDSLLESLTAKQKVANAILKTRAAGIKSLSTQDNYIEVVDSNGFVVREGFEIAHKKYVFIKAVLTAIDNLNRVELTDALMQDINNFFKSSFEKIGGDVSINDIDDSIGRFINKLSAKDITIALADTNNSTNLDYTADDYISEHDGYTLIQEINIVYG